MKPKPAKETYETVEERKARLKRKLDARASRSITPVPAAPPTAAMRPGEEDLDFDEAEVTDVLDLTLERIRTSHQKCKDQLEQGIKNWEKSLEELAEG